MEHTLEGGEEAISEEKLIAHRQPLLTFLHCVFSNGHTDCICLAFLRCVLSNMSSKHWRVVRRQLVRRSFLFFIVSFQMVTPIAFVWLFCTVCYQICPQNIGGW